MMRQVGRVNRGKLASIDLNSFPIMKSGYLQKVNVHWVIGMWGIDPRPAGTQQHGIRGVKAGALQHFCDQL